MADLSWSLAVGGGFAFFTSFGIGANDVANAFASSVGSGAVSYQKAVYIAAVFEFCGAVFLGSHVTGTISKGIADLDQFCETPEQVRDVTLSCVLMRVDRGAPPEHSCSRACFTRVTSCSCSSACCPLFSARGFGSFWRRITSSQSPRHTPVSVE